MKTGDLDIGGEGAEGFLETLDKGGGDGGSVDDARTKITTQQKTKYIMHIIILVAAHFTCFWYLPITGNVKLYGSPSCDQSMLETYGCKNFQQNGYLKFFYFILCMYLWLSALQIRHGFPMFKKASLILSVNHNPLALIGA